MIKNAIFFEEAPIAGRTYIVTTVEPPTGETRRVLYIKRLSGMVGLFQDEGNKHVRYPAEMEWPADSEGK